MKVISVGSDRKIFEEGSQVRARTAAYAARLGELHVVVFSLKKHQLKEVHAGPLHLYPTNSASKPLYILDAARLARRTPGDIITVQDPFEAGLVGLLAKQGRPLHVQLHTDPFVPEFAHGLNVVRHIISQLVLSHAARVRTVSARVAEVLRTKYPRIPVSVLPIFVDIEKYRALEKQPHPRFKTTLLWVGRFEDEKNPALALEALAGARAKGHEVGLVMLGTGWLEQELKKLAEELKVDEWVEFAGWQEPEKFLGVADLFLVTSRYEGYGRQIIEALAAGVPVLSTDVGVAREAGAIVTTEKDFEEALLEWLKSGPRKGELKDYPYGSFAEYVEKYCVDLKVALNK